MQARSSVLRRHLISATILSLIGIAAPQSKAVTAEEIMQKTVSKADRATNGSPRQNYEYNKTAITEKLDGKGNVEERKEKLIRIKSGRGSVIQMKLNGQPLSQDELKREQAQVEAEDERMSDSRVARRNDNWERLLTTDLISRFQFTHVRDERVNGRVAHVLTFKPASGELPVREISDRFINNLCGKIWVDAEDYEIATADLWLQTEVSLWGGILGNLRKFNYKVERVRLADGVWFNRKAAGEFVGRKFLDRVSVRTRVECGDFKKFPTAQARKD